MSIKSRFRNRHKRADWPLVKSLILKEGDPMLRDSEKPSEQPTEPQKLVTTPMGFQHPPGFDPAAFMVIGMNKEGQVFVNMPFTQPHLCLHLATLLMAQASQLAVMTLQKGKESPIVVAPAGAIPPWNGLSWRG